MTEKLTSSTYPLPPNGYILGMPGEHGFYVPVDNQERVASEGENTKFKIDSMPSPAHVEAPSTELTAPPENTDHAQQEVEPATAPHLRERLGSFKDKGLDQDALDSLVMKLDTSDKPYAQRPLLMFISQKYELGLKAPQLYSTIKYY